ncbi:MAG: nitric oxide reductase transcriptional regulator NorR [Syntrophobacteraceae bacterium]
MDSFDALAAISLDLTEALSAGDRYTRLLKALEKVIPYDAAALMRLNGNELVPVAARGLQPDAMGRRYLVEGNARLKAICSARGPVRFDSADPSPDPFDGLLEGVTSSNHRIHSCLGAPLRVEGRLIGTLTADALDPSAFDRLDLGFLHAVASLAAAQMQLAELMETLEATAERQGLIAHDLTKEAHMRQGRELLGHSRVMEHVRQEIELVARSDFSVLVLGETGVGKELAVRAIHAASHRRDAPLLYLNCAALPETLAESELFGHTKGAFTGAVQDRPGKFEMANGGTLFLDEVGELSLSIQPKLLRAIQEGEVQRLGSSKTVKVNVRLLAATNRNLEEKVAAGRFRADLFHRLNTYPMTIPPLRERREDVPALAGHFCESARRRLGLGAVRLSHEALDLLCRYSWPGNVRELENVLSRAILKASYRVPRGDLVTVQPQHLGDDLVAGPGEAEQDIPDNMGELMVAAAGETLREMTAEFQRQAIRRAISRNSGNWAAAARELGLHRSNLHNVAGRLGLRNRN